ncbi:hypothetical protein [Streptomyces sp. NPDC091278]|uniref:hypothetical protein n=1 Tax=Streptomyces sp. NPDC091278 TaxID=3155301 RepID=UPI00344F7CAB
MPRPSRPRKAPPYVVPWAGETLLTPDLVTSQDGVAYADPLHDATRRVDGVLWAVCGGDASSGGPEYASELHPERQREMMDGLLCAGCTREPERDARGALWLLPLLDLATDTVWETVRTVIPPLCSECADRTRQSCPRVREGHAELRVLEAEAVGVIGTLHPRPGQHSAPDPDRFVPYDSPDIAFTVARQVVRELRRITVVSVVQPPR